ncbi:TMV resistance protein N-like [Eucalyptus grandis]|uniref:TMV resistance protein N-like n=1 Tax=Eucalyptus grandis TaxID=71139 RepID=UPI00192E9145|nr:TMV resistance protein N-like [Eucalyptus grandis]
MASAVGAAGMKRKRAESSSTSSPSSEINYEVFLNFRGPDTRKGFTDHLHDRLRGAGIRVFRDEEDLPAGQEIKPELRKAIKRSRISIAILSKNYSQSEHCLMELVQMWECSKSRKHTIIPIFYDVSPSDVKDQDGVFIRSIDQLATKGAKAFTITYWKKVLGKIGDLRGYERTNVKG